MCVFTHTSVFWGMCMFMPPVAYSSKFSKVCHLFLKHYETVLCRVLFQETRFSFLILLPNDFVILTMLLNFLSKFISFIFIEKNNCPLFFISLLYYFRNDVIFLSVSTESVKHVYISIAWFGNYKRSSLPSNINEATRQLCLLGTFFVRCILICFRLHYVYIVIARCECILSCHTALDSVYAPPWSCEGVCFLAIVSLARASSTNRQAVRLLLLSQAPRSFPSHLGNEIRQNLSGV